MLNYDQKTRIVSLSTLRAICKKVSCWSHTFEVSKESRSRIHVAYNNPNEYGNAEPISVVFPCYPTKEWDSLVALDPIRFIGVPENIQDPWGLFSLLENCPHLRYDYEQKSWIEYKTLEEERNEAFFGMEARIKTLEQELLEANRHRGSLFNAARELIYELDKDIFTDAEECAESVAEVGMLRRELFRWVYSSVGNMDEAKANHKAHEEKLLAELRAQDNLTRKERTGEEKEVFENLVRVLEG